VDGYGQADCRGVKMNWLTKVKFNHIDLASVMISGIFLGRADYAASVLAIFVGALVSVLASRYFSTRKDTASSVQ